MYSVHFTPIATDDLSRLDKPLAQRIFTKIRWLAENFDSLTSKWVSVLKFWGLLSSIHFQQSRDKYHGVLCAASSRSLQSKIDGLHLRANPLDQGVNLTRLAPQTAAVTRALWLFSGAGVFHAVGAAAYAYRWAASMAAQVSRSERK